MKGSASGLAIVFAAGCAHVPGSPAVRASTAAPEVRVVLLEGDSLRVGGGAALRLDDGRGHTVAEVQRGASALIVRTGADLTIRGGGAEARAVGQLQVRARNAEGLVRVAGRDYRGRLVLSVTEGVLLAVNHLGIEEYLGGVVTAELGRRVPSEAAALEAQAIVSRTYALAALNRGRDRPFDLRATVADQLYLGVEGETAAGLAAVAATRGMVLTYGGAPVEPFFHSTCGGRTAAGGEVFRNADFPYLQSVSDARPDGTSWCAISPRYRWREAWTADQLRRALQGSLAAYGVAPEQVTDVVDIAVTAQTGSGRVAGLYIRVPRRTVTVSGSAAVRAVLTPAPGSALRSAFFDLRATAAAGRVIRLEVSGRGAGHGVGLCQWGAVARARAGQDAARIVAAYFAGTTLERRW